MTTVAPRTRRSRLTPEREAELYTAVLDLLGEVGYEALTMGSVAARTRCSKATLYRQWAGKPELVARALRHGRGLVLDGIDTGSLRGDLHEMVAQLDDEELEKETALARGLIHAVNSHPDLRRALRDLIVDPDPRGIETLLRRAVERGEVRPASPALGYLPYLLVGALAARPLMEGQAVDRTFLVRYLDAVVLPALVARPS
ncbi:TetR/AcrR family transcriptional regulator [Streptomyces fulvoviolaceus]|uniref:TetR/AcrR family transcriptional regulator n=1 Tax=Streptomyces fulvoviolaceus TaxID=285535 RepID=UPI0004C735BF|nr:TetR/AcrR family transcriptional regulator [Streptomyces fulvoviolaceus]MCT9077384.1 TetR/AcrR family transcriptional regulator [Streptomyces fulvoviolaceus]